MDATNIEPKGEPNSAPPGDRADDDLRRAMELLFFAYRDFIAEPDNVLSAHDFGRAHHRVVHFVGRNPGIVVNDLLAILKITKQSLSRVLSQLIREGFIEQATGVKDRRQRLLSLTDKGRRLELSVSADQRTRLAHAFDVAGDDAVAGFSKVLISMINNPDDVKRFDV